MWNIIGKTVIENITEVSGRCFWILPRAVMCDSEQAEKKWSVVGTFCLGYYCEKTKGHRKNRAPDVIVEAVMSADHIDVCGCHQGRTYVGKKKVIGMLIIWHTINHISHWTVWLLF